jgi:hypothetical protein
MYSVGSSSISFLRTQVTDVDVVRALEGRIVAFVGTETERDDTLNAPYSAFFILQGTLPETVQLTIPYNSGDPGNWFTLTPDSWLDVGDPLQEAFITEFLAPAGGFANALYAFPRGPVSKVLSEPPGVYEVPGLPYYAKDTAELYIYDDSIHKYVCLSTIDNVGMYQEYPEFMAPPVRWLRCDGSWVKKADYVKLYAMLGDTFNWDVPTPAPEPKADYFMLPRQSNLIVRALPR